MQVIPTRAQALRALESRRNQLLVEDRPEEAGQVEKDRRLIARAPGEDLYQMAQLSQQRTRSLQSSVLARDARAGWPMGPIGLGLGLLGGGLGAAVGVTLESLNAPIEIALPVGLVAIFGGMGLALIPEIAHRRGERAAETSQAIERNFSFIQSFTPPEQGAGQLSMASFLRLAAQREGELLSEGHPLRASDLKLVSQSLQSLSCASLEEGLDEVFRRAQDGPDEKRWSTVLTIVQDSPDVLSLVRSMVEVDNLAGGLDGRGGALEMRPDAIRIGSVVLRPKVTR
ncbi:hypothetical protein DYH09_30650 [bacterium CPR1]|nr:hypothetical protein [bacterium CPR1]